MGMGACETVKIGGENLAVREPKDCKRTSSLLLLGGGSLTADSEFVRRGPQEISLQVVWWADSGKTGEGGMRGVPYCLGWVWHKSCVGDGNAEGGNIHQLFTMMRSRTEPAVQGQAKTEKKTNKKVMAGRGGSVNPRLEWEDKRCTRFDSILRFSGRGGEERWSHC